MLFRSRVRAKGIPLSKYTKKYHAMYGEEVEQIDEESYAEKIRKHPAVQYYGAGEDHHMINLKKGYYFDFGGHDHMHSSSADNVRMAYQDLKKVKKCSDDKENCEHYNYGEKLEEGAADSSLSKKAEKSGVSLSTLRKVYNRGVAAWNSGHRPGTTPAQWGHARVNSYITKGKTYHTADKDLHEEIDVLFERQFDGTNSYREYAIAMTPGQSQEIKDVQGNTQEVDGQDQCGCGSGCDCNNVADSPTGASGDRITRSLKQIKAKVSEAKEKEIITGPVVDLAPIIQTKRKKGKQVRPIDTFRSEEHTSELQSH